MSNLIDNRQIRVFISSTFQDMQDERDYLMKHTFPMLRKKAAGREVTLTELDLRWGITPEESESGKVVEICLREIENSIPFFVGIIGDRYGWVPAENDLTENTKERFPQMKDYLERRLSVTEMEMQFGVLARKEDDLHAYFYIKEETTTAEKDNPVMLERLKEEVKKSKYPSSTYTSLEDLGSQVEQAFTALLDRLFPEGNITELERERIGQRSFMRQLCQNYIRDDNNFKALDDWMSDWERHQLVVTGASGLGKSALIANWTNGKLQDPNRTYNIICHFTGNGGSESSHEHILKVLADEIRDVYGWEREKEGIGMAQTAEIRMSTKDGMEMSNRSSYDDRKAGEKELDNLFIKVASEGDKPLLVILDAVNQIVDRDNAKLLNWLPVPPRNIKILFSTLEDDRTMEVFRNRRYPVLTLHPLSEDNRRRLANDYLHHYGKKLTDAQVTRIVTDSQCENTMVLKTLLDELINFGVYELLDSRIDYYLSPDTIEDFYQALLASYELDYGMDFVKHVLSLISVSKNGLTEDEILELTNTKEKPYIWAQFHCAILSHMTMRNGLIGFSHTYIQNAVDSRYINNDKPNETQCREEIVNLMETTLGSQIEIPIQIEERSRIEIPFQLFRMQAYERLHAFLLDAGVFNVLYDENKYELGDYWRSLTANGFKLSDYLPFIKEAELKICEHLTDFCINIMADYETASSVSGLFLAKAKSEGAETAEYADALELNGILLYETGDYPKALEYYGKSLSIRLKVLGENHPDTATSYNNIGNVYSDQGDYPKALEYHEKSLSIRLKVFGANHPDIACSYNNIGCVYDNQGDYPKALEYYEKSLSINEKVFGENHPATALSYNNIGGVYDSIGDYAKALEYYGKSLSIRLKVLGENHPATAMSYGCIGSVYDSLGDYPKALEYYEKSLSIREKVLGESHPDTATSYDNIGAVYDSLGDYPKAMEYQQKSLSIRLKVFGTDHPFTAFSYNNIGLVYKKQGDYPKALEYSEKSLSICLKVLGENHPATAISYDNIGGVYDSLDDYPKALEYHEKSLSIVEKVLGENHPATAISYGCIGSVYDSLGDYPKALEYYGKSLSIHLNVLGENHPATATSYNNIGLVYKSQGDYPKALEYYEKSLSIRLKVLGENHPATAASYNSIGFVYDSLGDYPKALEYYEKSLSIRKKVLGENHPTTATSYNDIGYIYGCLDDYDKALEYLFKALKIREEVLGLNHSTTATSYDNIGLIFDGLEDYDKALEYHFKALKIDEAVYGDKHPHTATSYHNIGCTYQGLGDYDKALEYYLKALEIDKKNFGENHPDTAFSYDNIGDVYEHLNDYDKALEYYFKALKIREAVFRGNNTRTATSYHIIGNAYDSLGDYDKALEYYFKALKIREAVLGLNHPDTALSYNNIGTTYYKIDDYDKALGYYFKSLKIREDSLGKDHPDTDTSYNNIGITYYKIDDYDKALRYYFKSLKIREDSLGKDHPDTATSYNNIGSVYRSMGDYENALIYRKKSLQYAINKYGEHHIETVRAYNNVGAQYRDLGKYNEALEYVGKALSIAESLEETESISCYHNRLGRIYALMDKKDEAVSHFHQSISLVPEDNEEAIDSRKRLEQLSENS